MRIQTDGHDQPARSQDAHGLGEKSHLVLKMMKGVDAKQPAERCACPRQTFSRPLREHGSRRVRLRASQHPSRGVQTRHASSPGVAGPKPMTGATANLENTLVGLLADEGHQGGLDTGVIVLLVSPVERFGNAVVVDASCHGGVCVLIRSPESTRRHRPRNCGHLTTYVGTSEETRSVRRGDVSQRLTRAPHSPHFSWKWSLSDPP